jgi:hypothetical protein
VVTVIHGMGDPSWVSVGGAVVAQPYVVVGGSGVLAPLGRLLAGPKAITVGISRGNRLARGDWDQRVALDAHDAGALRQFGSRYSKVEAVIAYEPALSQQGWEVLTRLARRRVIVLPSRYADPESSQRSLEGWLAPGGVTSVQLGWAGPADRPHWHTADEISEVAFRALSCAAGSRLVLGRIKPWSERPR